MRRKNFKDHTIKPKQPMESVHMDICGPMSMVTYGGGAIFSAACGGGVAILKSSHYIGQVPTFGRLGDHKLHRCI
jgi:hypothetical protein